MYNSKTIQIMEAKDFYRDNIALLYRRFGSFRTNARLFMASVPFEVKYELSLKKGGKPFQTIRLVESPIPVGALLLCWETYPELFRVEAGGKTGFIYCFNGSPLSGANCWSAVDPETGETFSGVGDRSFRTRCEALNAAVLQSREAVEEMKRRKGCQEFTPASLEELVEYVKGLGND